MTSDNKRIVVAAGARPNFMKIAPLMEQFSARRAAGAAIETLLVHTGQHYDEKMSRLFFDQLGIPRPDVNLEIGSGSHGQQTGAIMEKFEPAMAEWKPDALVVVGDVNSTLACALVAAKLHVPVAHVEAGLRSGDREMPEETNRALTDAISTWLFASEPAGVENLRRERVPDEKIHLVGNVMIDSLRKFLPAAKRSSVRGELKIPPGARYALLTLHRPSNVDDAESLGRLLRALNQIAADVPVIFPAHPRTQERLTKFGLASLVRTEWQAADRGVLMCSPIGYLEFLHLQSEALFVLTDSGGIQEETTALGVPCLTLRENTERPITVEQGTNTLVGSDPGRIVSEARAILAGRGKKGRVPELWDGRAAERIAGTLLAKLSSTLASLIISLLTMCWI